MWLYKIQKNCFNRTHNASYTLYTEKTRKHAVYQCEIYRKTYYPPARLDNLKLVPQKTPYSAYELTHRLHRTSSNPKWLLNHPKTKENIKNVFKPYDIFLACLTD